jgi:hypothetical protein
VQAGEYGRICPNTGVSRYELSVDTEGKLTAAACSQLHFKEVLLIRIISSGFILLSSLNVFAVFADPDPELVSYSVLDPDPESDDFFTLGSGIRLEKILSWDPGCGINIPKHIKFLG